MYPKIPGPRPRVFGFGISPKLLSLQVRDLRSRAAGSDLDVGVLELFMV